MQAYRCAIYDGVSYDGVILCVPALAQLGAEWQLYEQLAQQAQLPEGIAISMLAFISDDHMRGMAVEPMLRGFEERTVSAATTELADDLIDLAPYLDREQAQRALGAASLV